MLRPLFEALIQTKLMRLLNTHLCDVLAWSGVFSLAPLPTRVGEGLRSYFGSVLGDFFQFDQNFASCYKQIRGWKHPEQKEKKPATDGRPAVYPTQCESRWRNLASRFLFALLTAVSALAADTQDVESGPASISPSRLCCARA